MNQTAIGLIANVFHASSINEDAEACTLPHLLTDLYNPNYIDSNIDKLRNHSVIV